MKYQEVQVKYPTNFFVIRANLKSSKIGQERSVHGYKFVTEEVGDRSIRGSRKGQREKSGEVGARSNFLEGHEGAERRGGEEEGGGGGRFRAGLTSATTTGK